MTFRVGRVRQGPPKREWGTVYAKPKRRILVEGVDLGDGKLIRAWLVVGPEGVYVQRFGSWRKYNVSLKVAAGAIARAAQRGMTR